MALLELEVVAEKLYEVGRGKHGVPFNIKNARQKLIHEGLEVIGTDKPYNDFVEEQILEYRNRGFTELQSTTEAIINKYIELYINVKSAKEESDTSNTCCPLVPDATSGDVVSKIAQLPDYIKDYIDKNDNVKFYNILQSTHNED